ncbi:MAG: hypothetical protein JXQ65_12795 [Candidatus Marinimicrobia bacterium]|nr:hypothetical protein [Candidatus Neomarinimicrobiota bacterium]
MKYIFQAFIIFQILLAPLWAFGDKYANSFLKTGTGVREISLGGSVVAAADASTAFYWNPALLSGIKNLTGRMMHAEEFAGVLNLDHFSITIPNFKDYKIGIGFLRSSVDNIPLVKESSLMDIGNDGLAPGDENYPGPDSDGSEGNGKMDRGERLNFGKIGKFGTSESAFFLAAGKSFSKKLSLGISLKGISKNLYNTSALGFGLDLGAVYQVTDKLNIGASVSDFTTTYLFWNDGEREIIAPEIRTGVAYRLIIKTIPLSITPMAGFNMTFDGRKNNSLTGSSILNAKATFGLEMNFKNLLAFRFGRDENENFHIGAGISTAITSLNYGFSLGDSYSQLGNSHQIGLVFNLQEVYTLIKNNL